MTASNFWFFLPPKPDGDGLEYENLAFHVWQGDGFVVDNTNARWRSLYEVDLRTYFFHMRADARDFASTGRPPLLPILLAGLYSIFGRTWIAFAILRSISAVFLAIACAMAISLVAQYFRIADRKHSRNGNEESARQFSAVLPCFTGVGSALVLAASNRTLLNYATDFLTEPMALFLLQGFVVLMLTRSLSDRADSGSSRSKASKRSLVLAGGVWGTLVLARSIFVVWLPMLALLIYLAVEGTKRQRFQLALLPICVACLIGAIWWSRNVAVLGEFKPLGTQGPITLLGGYSDQALAAGGEWQFEPEQELRAELQTTAGFQKLEGTEQELMVAREASARTRSWLFAHLGQLPSMFAGRVVTHWNPYFGRSLLWRVAILLGGLSICIAIAQAEPQEDARRDFWHFAIWLLGIPLVSTIVVMLLYSVGGRFLVPAYGVLFTLAGIGIGSLVRVVQRKFLLRGEQDSL